MGKKPEKKKNPEISCTPDKTTGVIKCKYEGPVYTLPPEKPKTKTETTTF